MTATLAVHADWSASPGKRWLALARRDGEGWRVAAPEPVGSLPSLLPRLRAGAAGGAVALGVDLPLGLPRAYAAAHATEPDFPSFLRALAGRPSFFEVCATLAELPPARPFYPARGLRGMTRASHAMALGLGAASGLSRLCDRATAERPAGAPLFWTLGANQTGKAAITAWRDLLLPALAGPSPPALWPFDGDFLPLLARHDVVIAETYPAEAMRHLGVRMGGSKRRRADRAALSGPLARAMRALRAVPDPAMRAALADGFGSDQAGEDRFDCLLGLLCVLNVLDGRRPDGVPDDPWLRTWEGFVLGQTSLPLAGLEATVARDSGALLA